MKTIHYFYYTNFFLSEAKTLFKFIFIFIILIFCCCQKRRKRLKQGEWTLYRIIGLLFCRPVWKESESEARNYEEEIFYSGTTVGDDYYIGGWKFPDEIETWCDSPQKRSFPRQPQGSSNGRTSEVSPVKLDDSSHFRNIFPLVLTLLRATSASIELRRNKRWGQSNPDLISQWPRTPFDWSRINPKWNFIFGEFLSMHRFGNEMKIVRL